MASSSPRKQRILLLHGKGQNAETFRRKIGGLRSYLKSVAVFDDMEASHLCDTGERDAAGDTFEWWSRGDAEEATKAESLRRVREVLRTQGPFDGVLAFSQATGIVHALVEAGARGADADAAALESLRFVCLFSGFVSPSLESPALPLPGRSAITTPTPSPLSVHSFHCWGEGDEIIPAARSIALARRIYAASGQRRLCEVVSHEGGHHVPTAMGVKKPRREFVKAVAALGGAATAGAEISFPLGPPEGKETEGKREEAVVNAADEKAVADMMEMGLSKAVARAALNRTSSLDAAIIWALENADQVEAEEKKAAAAAAAGKATKRRGRPAATSFDASPVAPVAGAIRGSASPRPKPPSSGDCSRHEPRRTSRQGALRPPWPRTHASRPAAVRSRPA